MTSPRAQKKKAKPKPKPPKYTLVDQMFGRVEKVNPYKEKVNPFKSTDG